LVFGARFGKRALQRQIPRQDAAFGLGALKRRPYNCVAGVARYNRDYFGEAWVGWHRESGSQTTALPNPATHNITIVPGWGAAVLRPYGWWGVDFLLIHSGRELFVCNREDGYDDVRAARKAEHSTWGD